MITGMLFLLQIYHVNNQMTEAVVVVMVELSHKNIKQIADIYA